MKTPDYRTFVVVGGSRGCGKTLSEIVNARKSIHQLESTISQVSKALCGKENATTEELLQEVSQVKSRRLAQVERERDAAVRDIPRACGYCKNYLGGEYIPHCNTECKNISGINTGWQWRGPCPENTKDNIDKEADDHEISM